MRIAYVSNSMALYANTDTSKDLSLRGTKDVNVRIEPIPLGPVIIRGSWNIALSCQEIGKIEFLKNGLRAIDERFKFEAMVQGELGKSFSWEAKASATGYADKKVEYSVGISLGVDSTE